MGKNKCIIPKDGKTDADNVREKNEDAADISVPYFFQIITEKIRPFSLKSKHFGMPAVTLKISKNYNKGK